jgi:hypothetical protein
MSLTCQFLQRRPVLHHIYELFMVLGYLYERIVKNVASLKNMSQIGEVCMSVNGVNKMKIVQFMNDSGHIVVLRTLNHHV